MPDVAPIYRVRGGGMLRIVMLYSLKNPIQNYAWGSTTSLVALFGIANENNEPQAEMWMGAHPNGCSKVSVAGKEMLLSDLIASNPQVVLGERQLQSFGGLPYLLKLLAADKPLSIQVHPEKSRAAAGFARENAAGLAVDAPNRNYRDGNHKPELVYALTRYKAMNAFRPIAEIVTLFEQSGCTTLAEQVVNLKENPTSEQLGAFFRFILSLQGEQKETALAQLFDNIEAKGHHTDLCDPFQTVMELAQEYPGDVGLFSPLMLNVIELQPGQAMFLDAQTPHAYLKGTGVEIMANSDNVLRAGLTPKYMDVDELVANTRFIPVPADQLLTTPIIDGVVSNYPVPVDDFCFQVITLNAADVACTHYQQTVVGAEILLCIEGEMSIQTDAQELALKAGQSTFVSADTDAYKLQGSGRMVRISA